MNFAAFNLLLTSIDLCVVFSSLFVFVFLVNLVKCPDEVVEV